MSRPENQLPTEAMVELMADQARLEQMVEALKLNPVKGGLEAIDYLNAHISANYRRLAELLNNHHNQFVDESSTMSWSNKFLEELYKSPAHLGILGGDE